MKSLLIAMIKTMMMKKKEMELANLSVRLFACAVFYMINTVWLPSRIYHHPVHCLLFFCPFCRWINWGLTGVNNFLRVMELLRSEFRPWEQFSKICNFHKVWDSDSWTPDCSSARGLSNLNFPCCSPRRALGSRGFTLIWLWLPLTLMGVRLVSPSMSRGDYFPSNCFNVVGVEWVYKHLTFAFIRRLRASRVGREDKLGHRCQGKMHWAWLCESTVCGIIEKSLQEHFRSGETSALTLNVRWILPECGMEGAGRRRNAHCTPPKIALEWLCLLFII